MTLNTLAQKLRDQATSNNSIVLNGDILSQAQGAAIRTAFQLATDQFLTVSGVSAKDIPDPAGGKLQISAGTTSLLKQAHLATSLVLTLDDKDVLQCAIVLGLTDRWTFKDSFPGLDFFPL